MIIIILVGVLNFQIRSPTILISYLSRGYIRTITNSKSELSLLPSNLVAGT